MNIRHGGGSGLSRPRGNAGNSGKQWWF